MIDQLYPYIIQTVEALIRTNQLPHNIEPSNALSSDYWSLVNTKECIITDEVWFLFEFKGIFFQIEIKIRSGYIDSINVVKDLNKKITYET